MKYFHFSQNNSGGHFCFYEPEGITHHVVIQAKDADDANNRAVGIGLYFDGCENGQDCECCGDRWYPVGLWKAEGDPEPMVYGEPVTAFKGPAWGKAGKEIAVHHADGRIEWFGVAKVTGETK
jgi:hypothetical protein